VKASRHSSTALVIAKSTRLAAWEPELQALVPAGAVEVCEWFVSDHAQDAALLHEPWYRGLLARLEGWVLPGIRLHYAARKALLEAEVRRAIAGGARQVVVIGGGFDTLTYRLHRELPGVHFVELDHPATSYSKRESLARRVELSGNLSLGSADLTRTPLPEALEAAGVLPQLSTVVLVEGVLMYLTRETVEAFVRALSGFCQGALVLAFTFMVPDAIGRARFHNGSAALSVWLSLVGEPFLSAYGAEQLKELLARQGFAQVELWGDERLRNEVLPAALRDRPLAIGEHVCVARRS
jgi:methyltransferase (TIGR00027 family)